MINDPKEAARLLEQLKASLPLRARTTAALAKTLQTRTPGVRLPRDCTITEVHDTGDAGGIVGFLDFGSVDAPEAYIVSITHMTFDPRTPLSAEIKTYQRRRAEIAAPSHRSLAAPPGPSRFGSKRSESSQAHMPRASTLDRFARQIAAALSRAAPPALTPEMAAHLDENPEWVLDSLDGFVRQLGKDVHGKDPLTVAYLALMTTQLEYLRYRIDRGYEQAKVLRDEFERRLASLARSGEVPAAALAMITGAMREAKLKPGADVLAAGEDVLGRDVAALAEPGDVDRLLKTLARQSGHDAFALVETMSQATQAMPAEIRTLLAERMIVSSTPTAKEAAALAILDAEREIRRGVALSLLQTAEALTPTALRRLTAIRNWLPEDERPLADQAVHAARTKGVECAAWMPGGTIEIRASAIDGSGAQGILIVSPVGRRQRISSILLRQGRGVLDAWSMDPAPKRESAPILHEMAAAAPAHPISRDYLDRVVCHHLAVGLEHGAVPPVGLLAIAEIIGAKDWQPARLAWREMLDGLIAQVPAPLLAADSVEGIVATSAEWAAEEGLSDSWFEDGQDILDLLRGAGTRQAELVERVLSDILEQRKFGWAERLVWTALWLREGPKSGESLWPRFAILAREIAQGRRVDAIPLMREIASTTVAAMRAERI